MERRVPAPAQMDVSKDIVKSAKDISAKTTCSSTSQQGSAKSVYTTNFEQIYLIILYELIVMLYDKLFSL